MEFDKGDDEYSESGEDNDLIPDINDSAPEFTEDFQGETSFVDELLKSSASLKAVESCETAISKIQSYPD